MKRKNDTLSEVLQFNIYNETNSLMTMDYFSRNISLKRHYTLRAIFDAPTKRTQLEKF